MMNPFEFINDINFGKKNLFKDDDKNIIEKDYNSFIINRGLSYFGDTVLYANEMNFRHDLDKRMQNDYLLHSIRKKKRFSKWVKSEKLERIETIKQYNLKSLLHISLILKRAWDYLITIAYYCLILSITKALRMLCIVVYILNPPTVR